MDQNPSPAGSYQIRGRCAENSVFKLIRKPINDLSEALHQMSAAVADQNYQQVELVQTPEEDGPQPITRLKVIKKPGGVCYQGAE